MEYDIGTGRVTMAILWSLHKKDIAIFVVVAKDIVFVIVNFLKFHRV